MTGRNIILIAVAIFTIFSCEKIQEKHLLGAWQAAEALEEGTALPIDPSEIKIEFNEAGKYLYRGTLNYHESGTFSVNNDLLYTLDTVNSASTEKAVRILDISPDSLSLLMNEGGKERILRMYKVN